MVPPKHINATNYNDTALAIDTYNVIKTRPFRLVHILHQSQTCTLSREHKIKSFYHTVTSSSVVNYIYSNIPQPKCVLSQPRLFCCHGTISLTLFLQFEYFVNDFNVSQTQPSNCKNNVLAYQIELGVIYLLPVPIIKNIISQQKNRHGRFNEPLFCL